MSRFIELKQENGTTVLVNAEHISLIIDNKKYPSLIHLVDGYEIFTSDTYDDLRTKLGE